MLLNKFFRSKFNSGDTKREYEINIATDYVTSKTTYINTLASSVLVSRTTSYTTSWYSSTYRTTGYVTSMTTLKNTVKKIIIEDENSMNILMLGNFYLGNNIGPTLTYLANENVKELTIDGTLVRASTPGNSKTLPAGVVTKSNISGMLGDSLLEDTSYKSINIYNISTNGFYTNANNNDNIASWHKYHPVSTYSNSNDRFVYSKRNLFERIEFAKNKLNINNAFTHIVVALQDNNVLETNIETIKLKYMQLFLDLKSIGIDGTIVLLRKGNANYIEAQNQLIAENDFIVEGPDLSTILESNTTTPITIANSIKDSIITSMNFV